MKKQYKPVSFNLSIKSNEILEKIKDEYGIPKSTLIDKAIKFYVKEKHLLEE